MSQYKDDILANGKVVFNIREMNHKLYNFSDYKFTPGSSKLYQFNSSEPGKYSSHAIKMNDYYSSAFSEEGLNFVPYIYPQTNKFTMSFWVKPSTIHSATISMYGKTNGLYFQLNNANGYPAFQLVNNGTFSSWYTSNKYISLNTWHHCALTINGKILKVYVDGTYVIQATWNSDFIYSKESTNDNLGIIIHSRAANTYYDDLVMIADYIIWEDAFTVPNDLLLGEIPIPKKLSNKYQLFPRPLSRSDYFDKAYIY